MGCSTLKNFNLPILRNLQATLLFKTYDSILLRFQVSIYPWSTYHREVPLPRFGQKMQSNLYVLLKLLLQLWGPSIININFLPNLFLPNVTRPLSSSLFTL
jgi:hypothetical protein